MIDVGLLFRLVAHEVTTYYRLSWRWISIVATFFLTVAIFMAPTLGTLLAISQYYQILLSGGIFVGLFNTSFSYYRFVSPEMRAQPMRYLLALPVGKPILALSRILTAAVIGLVFSTFSVTIVLLLAGIPDIFGIGLIVVGLFLASISLSSLGVSLATYIVGEKVFPASDLIGFWLIFVSPIFYPIGVLPAFLLYPALLNPVTYGLGLVRAGIHIGTFNSIDLLALLFSSAFLVLVAYRGYLRRVDQIVMG